MTNVPFDPERASRGEDEWPHPEFLLLPEYRPSIKQRIKTWLMLFAAAIVARGENLLERGWHRVGDGAITLGAALFVAAYWGSIEEVQDSLRHPDGKLDERVFSSEAREIHARRKEFAQ